MIFYIKSENYITNQYNNILSDLTELQKREHKKMEIILDFLNKLNDFIQDENNIDNVQSFIKMLETLKNLSDNLRTNKNNLENLKILLNKTSPILLFVSSKKVRNLFDKTFKSSNCDLITTFAYI